MCSLEEAPLNDSPVGAEYRTEGCLRLIYYYSFKWTTLPWFKVLPYVCYIMGSSALKALVTRPRMQP